MENRQGLKNFSNTITIFKSELNAESFLLSLMVKIIFFIILYNRLSYIIFNFCKRLFPHFPQMWSYVLHYLEVGAPLES